MNLFFNDTSNLLPSEPHTNVNSTYVTITGLVVFGFPIVTMTIFCILRIQLDKRKRYRDFYLEDRIDAAMNQCPMIPPLINERTSSTFELDPTTNSSRFFLLLWNFFKADQTTSTDEEKQREPSPDSDHDISSM